jgi:hypothetical protein
MEPTRRDDLPGAKCHYRSERLQRDGNQWYFSTREGTLEGPFGERHLALQALERYVSIVRLNLLDTRLSLSDEY